MYVEIYRDVDVIIERKIRHQKYSALYKRNKRKGIGWCLDNGDIPVTVISREGIALSVYPVENNRGLAYSHRNAKRYRKTKKQLLEKSACYLSQKL